MGCGGSVRKEEAPVKETPVGSTAAAENLTWATKTNDGRQGPSPTAASGTVVDPAFKGGAVVNDHRNMIVQDADDDYDVEIIDEGKTARPSPRGLAAANGQEAPEAVEAEDAKKLAAEKLAAETALSKRQQEEAAKLAEQRKRFNNQRYQAPVAIATTTSTTTTTTATTESGSPAHFSGPGHNQSPLQNSAHEPLRTDMVMGLNLSTVPKQQDLIQDCLPGGIMGDTPRAELMPSKVNNKHQFDDEDEMLMKEILDESIDF